MEQPQLVESLTILQVLSGSILIHARQLQFMHTIMMSLVGWTHISMSYD